MKADKSEKKKKEATSEEVENKEEAAKANDTSEQIEENNASNESEEKVDTSSDSANYDNVSAEISDVENKFNTLKDQHLRVLAEYENYRKRTEKEKLELYDRAKCDAIKELLDVFDSLQLAVEQKDCSKEDLEKGLNLIMKNCSKALEKLKVDAFGEVGDEFNPEIHQAVEMVNDCRVESNQLARVYRKGYKVGSMIIRHATVVVNN